MRITVPAVLRIERLPSDTAIEHRAPDEKLSASVRDGQRKILVPAVLKIDSETPKRGIGKGAALSHEPGHKRTVHKFTAIRAPTRKEIRGLQVPLLERLANYQTGFRML
jgi:hypothetical protein